MPPHQPPPPSTGTPDWAQLADATAARSRRRKLLIVGGGVLGAGAVAAIVATAVVMTGKNDKADTTSGRLPSASASPEPTFAPVAPPSPPDPREFISSADKDKAPLTTQSFFPQAQPVMSPGAAYRRTATDTAADCTDAAEGGLGQVLQDNGCRQVLRATYVRDGVAVTVGVAVFDTKAAADKAKDQYTGNITPLPGDDGTAFCRGTTCRNSANTEGRYAYFTVAGYTNGTAVPADDTKALAAGRDAGGYVFRRILARGSEQAAASVRSKTPGH
ncbi:hypothetical protein LKL35_29945 [Streptomyces sp. ET3-23]|uniref:hypothetical protein n=1 Tax=Streptomyces sp. ET3-23 TaxID=2885643 RepID=UPI001D1024FD|nr:hypothetical protein [Streptomyces sp. ET3-23]MCC2279618.1 hypothetical protein [Streptomyces sp. ET3-23]